MKTHLRLCALAVGLLGLATASPARANPDATIFDTYWGADDHGWGDVIGDAGRFNIGKAEVTLAGTWLTVDIYTAFATQAGVWFTGYTRNPESHTNDQKGIGYGDLFLAESWTPHAEGASGQNGDYPTYNKDDSTNGTLWTYAISIGDGLRWGGKTTTRTAVTLYQLRGTNDENAYLSDDYLFNATWRNKQVVAVDTVDNSKVERLSNNAFFTVQSDFLRFELDLAGTSLAGKDQLALHWGQTCANDVIEGRALNLPKQRVPEPTTLALLGLGLAGIGYARREKGREKACRAPR